MSQNKRSKLLKEMSFSVTVAPLTSIFENNNEDHYH